MAASLFCVWRTTTLYPAPLAGAGSCIPFVWFVVEGALVFRGVKFPGRSCEGRARGRGVVVMSRIYERTVMSVTAFDNRGIISCVSCLMRAYTDDSMIDVATGKRIADSTFYMPSKEYECHDVA